MSYAIAAALQEAIFTRLAGDPGVTALVGANVFDAAPAGPVPESYVLIGEERAQDRSDATGRAARHDVTVSVVTSAPGFRAAKNVAVAISDALRGAPPALSRGRLVSLDFTRATARRTDQGQTRRIDLIFRAFVDDV